MSAAEDRTKEATNLLKVLMTAPEEDEERYDATRLYDALDREGLILPWPGDDPEGPSRSAPVLRLSGRYALPVPLAETFLARWLLSSSGLPAAEGWLTVAPVRRQDRLSIRRDGKGWALCGALRGVPHARSAARIVVAGRMEGGESAVAVLEPEACGLSRAEGLSGEPRDNLKLDDGVVIPEESVAPCAAGPETLLLVGSLARALQMGGAMERVLELSVAQAREREQFGRPVGRFQAIQHHLAVLAGEAAAASAAAEASALSLAEALGRGDEAGSVAFEVSSAKVRAGEAAGEVATIAHQVHGAIGFTERHPLRHYTKRLWAWRDEFGSESEWAGTIGAGIAANGPEALWATLTDTRS